LAYIRLLELEFAFGERYGCEGDEPFALTYSVRLDKRRNSYNVQCASTTVATVDVADDQSPSPQDFEAEREVLLQEIKRVLDGFVAERKIDRLGPQDFDDLVHVSFAVENCPWSLWRRDTQTLSFITASTQLRPRGKSLPT
jgi:hypothetical protein